MKTVAEYKFFVVVENVHRLGGKTSVYSLVGRRDEVCLGEISWYGGWRQFCFFPGDRTVWNDACLADINDFLGKLRAERKNQEDEKDQIARKSVYAGRLCVLAAFFSASFRLF